VFSLRPFASHATADGSWFPYTLPSIASGC
jgi:hypothetical protein